MTSRHANSLTSPGRCYLVGAGPGDPELLTIKAFKLIQSATLLLVDDLVSADIVKLASPKTRVIAVGKRGGRESTSQEFIEKLMIMAARQGEVVVRLKGGDPFIFGRGGEEVEHLRAAGVQVEVVNGITAGLAAATSLGVSLTHRDHAHGVVFVTGHPKPGGVQNDWRQLGQTAHAVGLTLVVYMGVSSVPHIQTELLAGGLPASTPVALVQSASLPTQQQVITQLGEMSTALVRSGLGSPCVFVIGQVVQQAASSQAGLGAWQGEMQLRRTVGV